MTRRAVKYKSAVTKKPTSFSKRKLKERTPKQEGVSYGDASRILTRALDEAMDYWRERSLIHYEYYRYIKENGKAPQQLSIGGDTYSFDAVLWTAGRYRLT